MEKCFKTRTAFFQSMSKKDIQFAGFLLIVAGGIGAVTSSTPTFSPLNQGGISAIIAIIGLAVYWYGIRTQ